MQVTPGGKSLKLPEATDGRLAFARKMDQNTMDMIGLALVVIAYHVELRISENVQNYCIFCACKNS